MRVELDDTARRVYCSDCGDEVDPFSALQMLAADFDRWRSARDTAKREAQRVAEELASLKRQRSNLKAQIRRARAKADG